MKAIWMLAGIGLVVIPFPARAQFAPPTGIYALGSAQDNLNTATDERLSGIRDYDFLSGFTLRVLWSDIETTQGAFDFAVIDEALRRVSSINQRLNLEVLDDMPDYVIAGASATYIDHRGGTRPVPWDAFAQSRYAALQNALASHVVEDDSGDSLPLNEHPRLAAVDASSVGLNFGVRDINSGIRTHADYTQERYINSVLQGVAANRSVFPNHQGFLAFFGFNDGQPGVPVDQQLITLLDAQYNGPDQSALAFFIENLSDTGPTPLVSGGGAGNNLLAWTNLGGATMIQALDSWLQHRPDRDAQLLSLNPATGIDLAYNLYGTRFFELYLADIDGAFNGAVDASGRPIIEDLRFWNTLLNTASEPLTADFDLDNDVDSSDLVVWNSHYGATTGASKNTGDADGDGDTDGRDFLVWQRQFGSVAAPFIAIPEPGTPVLWLGLGAIALGLRQRFV